MGQVFDTRLCHFDTLVFTVWVAKTEGGDWRLGGKDKKGNIEEWAAGKDRRWKTEDLAARTEAGGADWRLDRGIGGVTTGAQGARATLKFQDSTVLIRVVFAHL